MNSREWIDRGAANTTLLCLYKEGMFYKLYSQYAMLFTANIKKFKIKAKFIKAVNQQIYIAVVSCRWQREIKEQKKSPNQILPDWGFFV